MINWSVVRTLIWQRTVLDAYTGHSHGSGPVFKSEYSLAAELKTDVYETTRFVTSLHTLETVRDETSICDTEEDWICKIKAAPVTRIGECTREAVDNGFGQLIRSVRSPQQLRNNRHSRERTPF